MTTQTANNEGLESIVKYVRENQEPIKYTVPIAFAVAALDQFVLGNRGLDNVSLDILATYGAYCGLTKKIADPIPAIIAYFTAKLGYEPIFTPKEAGLDSLWGSAVALIGTAGLARGLRYAKDNWDEKTKPAIYATGRFIKKNTPKVLKGTGKAGYATGKGIGTAASATGKFAGKYSGLDWLGRKLNILPKKVLHQPAIVTDTQNIPLQDMTGAKIVVEGSDSNIQKLSEEEIAENRKEMDKNYPDQNLESLKDILKP